MRWYDYGNDGDDSVIVMIYNDNDDNDNDIHGDSDE